MLLWRSLLARSCQTNGLFWGGALHVNCKENILFGDHPDVIHIPNATIGAQIRSMLHLLIGLINGGSLAAEARNATQFEL